MHVPGYGDVHVTAPDARAAVRIVVHELRHRPDVEPGRCTASPADPRTDPLTARRARRAHVR